MKLNLTGKQCYVWSDQHRHHFNILRYSSRPFPDVESMNAALQNSLDCLPRGAFLFDLGDFSFGGYGKVKPAFDLYFRKLHDLGVMLYMCRGNHDEKLEAVLDDYQSVCLEDRYEVKNLNNHFILDHYPLESWNGDNHGSIHCHGHTHGELETSMGRNRLHVGVDTIGFAPISFTEAVNRIKKRDAQIKLPAEGIELPTASKPE